MIGADLDGLGNATIRWANDAAFRKARRLAVGRTLLIAVAILAVGVALANGATAQSSQQNKEWCAYFTGGPTNCGFATFEGCLHAIEGKTALCVQNAQYARGAGSDSSTGNGQ